MPIIKDFTGMRFGKWIVLRRIAEKGKPTRYLCRCDCGNEKEVLGTNLQRGRSQSCGKCKYEDLTGKRFGRLIAMQKDPSDTTGRIRWICKCDCGSIKSIEARHLKDGTTISCGCFKREQSSKQCKENLIDITNQRFGKLIVLGREITKDSSHHIYWRCQCDCGKTIIARGDRLKNNEIISCGCESGSQGELLIAKILNDAGIPFQREKTFSGCINPKTGYNLRFDFYVDNKYLIEFDGKQHFQDVEHFTNCLEIQERDKIKNQWCKENNIPLIRIPYTKLKTLSLQDLQP